MALTACTTPDNYSSAPMKPLDAHTNYSVVEDDNGFTINVKLSRYQFIPETSAIVEACKSSVMSAAYDHADTVGKDIESINEQRIRISTGRNALLGMTSCSASVPVTYK